MGDPEFFEHVEEELRIGGLAVLVQEYWVLAETATQAALNGDIDAFDEASEAFESFVEKLSKDDLNGIARQLVTMIRILRRDGHG